MPDVPRESCRDRITEEERRLINEFLANHEVTKPQDVVQSQTLPSRTNSALRNVKREPQKKTSPQVVGRQRVIAEMAAQGRTGAEIIKALEISAGTLYRDLRALGLKLPKSRSRCGRTDKAAAGRQVTNRKAVRKLRDRRRHKEAHIPDGSPPKLAPRESTGTVYPNTLMDPAAGQVLKDGANNAKIGGDVLVGALKGARILTLTLEERATCPRSCGHWRDCYGNNMPRAHRFRHSDALMPALRAELEEHCSLGKVLVRLHVLGDFYSVEYVRFWAEMLGCQADLHVFGFTGWPSASEIGVAISAVRNRFPSRFMIRDSHHTGEMGSAVLPRELVLDPDNLPKRIGNGVICPEQIGAIVDQARHPNKRRHRHCGSCAVCWESRRPIIFLPH